MSDYHKNKKSRCKKCYKYKNGKLVKGKCDINKDDKYVINDDNCNIKIVNIMDTSDDEKFPQVDSTQCETLMQSNMSFQSGFEFENENGVPYQPSTQGGFLTLDFSPNCAKLYCKINVTPIGEGFTSSQLTIDILSGNDEFTDLLAIIRNPSLYQQTINSGTGIFLFQDPISGQFIPVTVKVQNVGLTDTSLTFSIAYGFILTLTPVPGELTFEYYF